MDSLIQVLIAGQNRLGIVDWACDNFIRFAYTLDLISYVEKKDSFTITKTGLELTQANNEFERFKILKGCLKSYTPVIRVLELLFNQRELNSNKPSLTKFEIGRELGFKGEDGFSTFSQNVFIQALNSAETKAEKNKIKQNWEGSSDKYARMICNWLMNENIDWIKKTRKSVSIKIGDESFTEKLQSYQITISGITALKSSGAYSRNKGSIKKVFFEMLATKGADKEYLRKRRTHLLKCINRPKSTEQIVSYYKKNKFENITTQTIKDDIENLKRIGLKINDKTSGYKLKDKIELLEIPNYALNLKVTPSSLENTKQNLRETLKNLDHKYLDILDFSISGKSGAIKFEVRIVELLNEIIIAKHLSGGNRPEIIGYNPEINPLDCLIMDSKAYSKGFSIPANERDKMIRYVEEYIAKDINLNSNRWWEEFKSPDYPTKPVKFGFISSSFIGQYINQLAYINNRTEISGSVITAEVLLKKVDQILSTKNEYNLNSFFTEIGSNEMVN